MVTGGAAEAGSVRDAGGIPHTTYSIGGVKSPIRVRGRGIGAMNGFELMGPIESEPIGTERQGHSIKVRAIRSNVAAVWCQSQ